jgi:hypothetical protein
MAGEGVRASTPIFDRDKISANLHHAWQCSHLVHEGIVVLCYGIRHGLVHELLGYERLARRPNREVDNSLGHFLLCGEGVGTGGGVHKTLAAATRGEWRACDPLQVEVGEVAEHRLAEPCHG